MTKLIFGCGYLGLRVARRWLAEGHRVVTLSRSEQRAETLRREGLEVVLGDVSRSDLRLPDFQPETVLWAVGYDRQATPSMRDVYVDGLVRGLDHLPHDPEKIIYISSTGVYGQADGEWIDESAACQPTREGGRICLEAEQALRAHRLGNRSVILRLAGIYGPGRLPRREDLRAGRPLAAPGQGYLNLIHVDDAVTVVLQAERQARVPDLYLVADGNPPLRIEYYRFLAELIGAPAPQLAEPEPDTPKAQRAAADKRISNRRMREELHVQLRYPTYREGLQAAVRQEEADLDPPGGRG